MTTKTWQRGTCAKCRTSMWLYVGTDGKQWVHDTPQWPIHLATDQVPDVVADAADERVKELVSPRPYMPDSEPEDSFSFGGLDGWTPWEGGI